MAGNEHPLALFASRLENEPWLRRGLFGIATLLCVGLIGYYFGTFDQSIHIPFLKAWSDPTLFPNDPFLALRYSHYSLFWFLFIPFYKLGILEPVLFIFHLLATYLTFQATWDLAYTLFEDPLTAFFAVLAIIFPHMSLAGFPIFEFSLLNRTFVLPFSLMAITLYLRGRRVQSFLLLGFMFNLHVLTVLFALALLGMLCLRDLLRAGWKDIKVLAAELAVFVLAALPVLVWRFVYGVVVEKEPLDLSINPVWIKVVGNGALHHLFYLFDPQFYILVVNACGVAALGLFLIANRKTPSPLYASELRWMATGALLVLFAQFIAGYWLPVTIVLELQIARVSVLLLILCQLYFAHYLAQLWRSRTAAAGKERLFGDGSFNLIAGMFFVTQSAVFPFLAWILVVKNSFRFDPKTIREAVASRMGKKRPIIVLEMPALRAVPAWLAVTSVLLGFAICIYIGALYGMWKPGVYVYPPASPWLDVQYWAKNNTSKDTIFITPPQIFDPYEPDWRVFSERTDVATITDVLEIALAPKYLDVWLPRFNAIAPGAVEQFNGDYFHSKKVIAEAYYSLSEDAILAAACQYHADYLVFEKPNQRNFPLIYQNQGFVVYDLTGVKNCGVAVKPQN